LIEKGNAIWGEEVDIDVTDGIIECLTKACGGNVHKPRVVDITSGSFGKETYRASLGSGVFNSRATWPPAAYRRFAPIGAVSIRNSSASFFLLRISL
jgi:hypothetical protein